MGTKVESGHLPVAVIDVETAQGFNVSYQPVCAIAVCHIETDGTIKDSFKFFVQPPGNEISLDTTAVHGITPEMTKDAPDFKTLWPKILESIDGRVLAAHNADFDFSVIETELEKADITPPKSQYVCTLDIARALFPNFENHKLSSLTREFGIELDHHDPASDAKATAEVLKIMMEKGNKMNPIRLSKKYDVPVGIFGEPPRWPAGLRDWQRKPHFKKVHGKWAIAAQNLKQGEVISVKKKSGEISLIEIGSELEEVEIMGGGKLIASMDYKDVTEKPEYKDFQSY